ncbi:MAG: exo-alpha-sialidase [Alistipes sp.]|nr:exo-alpha-sialidase [Alistipes sp.]
MKKLHILALGAVALLATACSDSFEFGTPTHDLDGGDALVETVLWKNGDQLACTGRTHNFRIPAIIRTQNRLIAFAEAREYTGSSNQDTGDIDLVYRISTDNGVTWGETKLLLDDYDNTCGNPCPIFTESGKLVVFCGWQRTGTKVDTFKSDIFTFEESQRFVCHALCLISNDEGDSWSTPTKWFHEQRNADESQYKWTSFLKMGPGHAIQLKTGPHKGRLVVGCDHKYEKFAGKAVIKEADETYYGSHIAYSDDEGQTWKMLELNEELHFGNECIPVELSNGDLYLDMRCTGQYNNRRAYSFSQDGGINWSRLAINDQRIDPGCQGSIINYTTNGVPSKTILGLNNNSTSRTNLSIRASLDDCKTWKSTVLEITSGKSGYSDLAVLSDGSLLILYETGANVYREKIVYCRVSQAQITKYLNL